MTLRAVFLSAADRHTLVVRQVVHIHTIMVETTDIDYPEHEFFILTADHDLANISSDYVHEEIGCFLGLIGVDEDPEVLRDQADLALAGHAVQQARAN